MESDNQSDTESNNQARTAAVASNVVEVDSQYQSDEESNN